MPNDGSWVTKPKNQIIVGTFIAACIFLAGLIPILAVQSEQSDRQEDIAQESLVRDAQIKKESVRITCGIVLGFERLTPQIALTGNEDLETRARIMKTNSDRLAARDILRSSLPADIVKKCPEGG